MTQTMTACSDASGASAESPAWQLMASGRSMQLESMHGGDSPLAQHTRLLFWLAEHLDASIQVTLGEQDSLSHLAVCQAVRQLGLATRCHLLAGTGTALQPEVRELHDRLYGDFSRMLPAGWDEDGLQHFRCGAIDWLHIDGEQELEQLRASWRSWRRRLSSRSLLGIHGVKNSRSSTLGAWIARLQNCHPWAEFKQGDGLLLVAVGEHQPTAVQSLFQALRSPSTSEHVGALFAQPAMAVCAPSSAAAADLLSRKARETGLGKMESMPL